MAFTSQQATPVASFTSTSSEVELLFKEVLDASGNSAFNNSRKYGNKVRIVTDLDVTLAFSRTSGSTVAIGDTESYFFPAGIVEVIEIPDGARYVAGITPSGTAAVNMQTGYGE